MLLQHAYKALAFEGRERLNGDLILEALVPKLFSLWESDYAAMPGGGGEWLEVLSPDRRILTLFHLARGRQSTTEDHVVAVCGFPRSERASSRDRGRMAGFLKKVWSATYPGYDRGHFFAHTMGGGLDINLFPQRSSVNRGGRWRELEEYARNTPGCFCFVRPLYVDLSWKPAQLEYGVFDLPPERALDFQGEMFPN